MTTAHYGLLCRVHYGAGSTVERLPANAASDTYTGDDTVTEADCRDALVDCMTRGWLRVINEPALTEIVAKLRADNVLGPIYRLPPLEAVDFTEVGADIWRSFCDRNQTGGESPPFGYPDIVHQKTAYYFRNLAAATATINELRTESKEVITAVSRPRAIGPWHVQWWRRFSEGVRVDVEERMLWQGRNFPDNSWNPKTLYETHATISHLQSVLSAQGIGPPEWFVLNYLDGFWSLHAKHSMKWARENVKIRFGINLTEAQCDAGLETCLRNGWARVTDSAAIAEMTAYVRQAPALTPLTDLFPSIGNIDFTPAGAELYQRIATELFRPEWDAAIHVCAAYYYKRHKYFAADVEPGPSPYSFDNETMPRLSHTVTPIGPWCVFWWERFDRGIRVEEEFGHELDSSLL